MTSFLSLSLPPPLSLYLPLYRPTGIAHACSCTCIKQCVVGSVFVFLLGGVTPVLSIYSCNFLRTLPPPCNSGSSDHTDVRRTSTVYACILPFILHFFFFIYHRYAVIVAIYIVVPCVASEQHICRNLSSIITAIYCRSTHERTGNVKNEWFPQCRKA